MPTDKELLEDDGDEGPVVSSPAVRDLISKVKREEASGATRPPPIKKPVLPADEMSGATQPPPIKTPPLIVDNGSEPDPKPAPGAARAGALDGLFGGGALHLFSLRLGIKDNTVTFCSRVLCNSFNDFF